MRRPDVFTLDYSHPLAQGLVLAGFAGLLPGFIDSSALANHSASGVVQKRVDSEHSRSSFVVPGASAASVQLAQANNAYRLTNSVPLACAFWARFPYNSTNVIDGVVKHGTYNSLEGNGAGWWFGYDRETTTYYRRRVRFSSYFRSFWQAGYFTENTLHHYYLESSASGWKVYTDGYLNNSGTNGVHQNTEISYAPVLFNCVISSEISDILLFRRALSPAEIALLADRTDPMLGGLIVEERPVLYFDMGGSTEVEGPAVITAASTIVASGSRQATSPATVTASASVGIGGVKGAVAPLNIVGSISAEASGIKSTSGPATITAAAEYGASGIKTIIGLDKEGPAVITASATVGMGGVKGGIGAAVLGADSAVDAGWAKGAIGQSWFAAAGEFYAVRGPDDVPIAADEIGRAVSLQARNYSAVLAKRNYTARL